MGALSRSRFAKTCSKAALAARTAPLAKEETTWLEKYFLGSSGVLQRAFKQMAAAREGHRVLSNENIDCPEAKTISEAYEESGLRVEFINLKTSIQELSESVDASTPSKWVEAYTKFEELRKKLNELQKSQAAVSLAVEQKLSSTSASESLKAKVLEKQLEEKEARAAKLAEELKSDLKQIERKVKETLLRQTEEEMTEKQKSLASTEISVEFLKKARSTTAGLSRTVVDRAEERKPIGLYEGETITDDRFYDELETIRMEYTGVCVAFVKSEEGKKIACGLPKSTKVADYARRILGTGAFTEYRNSHYPISITEEVFSATVSRNDQNRFIHISKILGQRFKSVDAGVCSKLAYLVNQLVFDEEASKKPLLDLLKEDERLKKIDAMIGKINDLVRNKVHVIRGLFYSVKNVKDVDHN